MHTQYPTNQLFPSPRVEFTHPRILSIYSIANDSIIGINQWEKLLKVPNIKLPIRVHEEDQFLRRRCKATHQRGSIALVCCMANETNTRIRIHKCYNNLPCTIRTPIIDNQDLKIHSPCIQYI